MVHSVFDMVSAQAEVVHFGSEAVAVETLAKTPGRQMVEAMINRYRAICSSCPEACSLESQFDLPLAKCTAQSSPAAHMLSLMMA